tara:strand:+ start:794 stop:1036 length:243 start_codon:yes stop_codon:yes gene_type:complete
MTDKPLQVDFKIFGGDERGLYYEQTHRALIFLNNHESLDDIYQTIQHEVIHHIIRNMEDIDELQEESLIFRMQWAKFSIF